MVAFNYSSLDIDTWCEGGPTQCPCFSSGLYLYNLHPHGKFFLSGPLFTFSKKEIIYSLIKAVLEKMKINIFFDVLPKSDASGDGKQDFYVT